MNSPSLKLHQKFFAVLLSLAFMVAAGLSVAQIARTYEERSLFSYMLKTGDSAASAEAKRHVSGARRQGVFMSSALGLTSLLAGVVVGAAVGRRSSTP